MIEGFNDFVRPEFCKVEVMPQAKYEAILKDELKAKQTMIKHHL
jgi:hypothetical protein